jgi:hypothetical protein
MSKFHKKTEEKMVTFTHENESTAMVVRPNAIIFKGQWSGLDMDTYREVPKLLRDAHEAFTGMQEPVSSVVEVSPPIPPEMPSVKPRRDSGG